MEIKIVAVITLVLMSAVFSGLGIGMFSLSITGLERKVKLGYAQAKRVLDIRSRGNFLLCTLLLGNAAVNSGIAIILGSITTGVYAAALSTIIIFLFGEVLPQAVFTRYPITVGYHTAWLVRILMFLLWPVAKPLSMALDAILGKEFPEKFDKQELKVFIEEQHAISAAIDGDETRIMLGTLKYSEKIAKNVMTPSTILYRLSADIEITPAVLLAIQQEHYSRIPVYMDTVDNIIGILYAKDLIGFVPDGKTVGDMCKRDNIIIVKEDMHLDSILNHFLKTKSHMSFVYNEFGSLLGIVTLEDILEQVLNIEIMDEADTEADLQHAAMKIARVPNVQ